MGKDPEVIDNVRQMIARGREVDKIDAELTAVVSAIGDFETLLRAAIESTEYGARRW